MKKVLAGLLTFCMIAALVSPAGTVLLAGSSTDPTAELQKTEAAAEQETASKLEADADEVIAFPQDTASDEQMISGAAQCFDQAIRDLYDNSMSATDEDVLASAQLMPSDFGAIESALGAGAPALIASLKSYEVAKSQYMTDNSAANTVKDINIIEEWKKQEEYTSYVMPATDVILTLVPRIKVTDFRLEDNTAVMDIYEWMTVGYAPDKDQQASAAAYGYNFSMKAELDANGNWQIAAVGNTEQNFVWMEEEAKYASEVEEAGTDDRRVVSEDGVLEMMAASAAMTYSYNVSNAIAYADRYCINYNNSYNSYKGRGGDCANFVSQCLYAGGFKQNTVWYKHSVAWINVMKQIAHFKQYGSFLNATNSNLIKGNPIYFDWNGDSTYDHATICVGRNNSGIAILDSHTRDLYHATWTNWSFKKAATIQLRTSGTVTNTQDGGFKTDSVGKYYEYSDGTRLKGCFETFNGKTYYFKSDGYVAKGLTKINGDTYLFNTSTGVMCTGWVTYRGNRYYFGTSGAAYTEWEEIDGHYYYFNPDTCVMATGFYRVKTKLHYFGTDGIERFGFITVDGKKYYLDQYGVVQFGWQTLGGRKYYFDSNGVMVTGNVKIDGVVYKFDTNGVCRGKATGTEASTAANTNTSSTNTSSGTSSQSGTSTTVKKGWLKEGGKWYYYKNGVKQTGWLRLGKDTKRVFYLGSNGAMRTGWVTISGSKYFFDNEGVLQKGWLKYNGAMYYLQSNGKLKKGWLKYNNAWYYLQTNGKMKTGWLKLGNSWYYLQSNGKMKTGWFKDKDGLTYYLRSDGTMATGRNMIGGRVYNFRATGSLIG